MVATPGHGSAAWRPETCRSRDASAYLPSYRRTAPEPDHWPPGHYAVVPPAYRISKHNTLASGHAPVGRKSLEVRPLLRVGEKRLDPSENAREIGRASCR